MTAALSTSHALLKSHPRMLTNNFDSLRLMMAVTVFLAHTYALSGNPSLAALGYIFDAKIAVQCFFVISGFLIFMSYENCRSLTEFFQKRARRIYPAYVVVILLCVVGGALITTLPLRLYLGRPLLRFLAANLIFLNYLARSLPGVFDGHQFPDVNGALWTIKVEVMFYLSVPVIVQLMRKFGKLPVLSVIYFLSLVFRMYCDRIGAVELAKQLPGQMSFFAGGALAFYYFGLFERFARWLLAGAVVVVVAESFWRVSVLSPLAVTALTIYAACFWPALGRFRPKWDLSYGVYIMHFPILQVFVSLGWLAGSGWPGVVPAAGIVFSFACLSWNFVEKPFLGRRKRSLRYSVTAAKAY